MRKISFTQPKALSLTNSFSVPLNAIEDLRSDVMVKLSRYADKIRESWLASSSFFFGRPWIVYRERVRRGRAFRWEINHLPAKRWKIDFISSYSRQFIQRRIKSTHFILYFKCISRSCHFLEQNKTKLKFFFYTRLA